MKEITKRKNQRAKKGRTNERKEGKRQIDGCMDMKIKEKEREIKREKVTCRVREKLSVH